MLDFLRAGVVLILLCLSLSTTIVHASDNEEQGEYTSSTVEQNQFDPKNEIQESKKEASSWLTLYGAIVFLLIAALIAILFLRSRNNLGISQGPIKIHHAVSIGQRQRLIIISYNDQEYLLAQTNSSVTVINRP